jgi:tetratricopeptide (TPR) repeat protein
MIPTLTTLRKPLDGSGLHSRRRASYAPALSHLGNCLERTGKTVEAEAAYNGSLTVPLSLIGLARLRLTAGDPASALAFIEKAIRLDPRDSMALKLAARSYRELDRPHDAVRVLESAALVAPRDASVRYQLVRLYQSIGEPAKSSAAFRTSNAFGRFMGRLHDLRADVSTIPTGERMEPYMSRRALLRHSLAAAALTTAMTPIGRASGGTVPRRRGVNIKIGVNAYSFNRPLVAGKMTLEDVIDFCARHNVDGLDPTGYYFPGYPVVPSDEYIYKIKRAAYLQGVTLSGTGVRNDFALTDPDARKQQIQLVKNWIDVAQKLGAGFIRVFSGRAVPAGHTFDQVLEWMIPAFQECADYGGRHGVIVGLQHHDDFLKTASETIRVVEAVAITMVQRDSGRGKFAPERSIRRD